MALLAEGPIQGTSGRAPSGEVLPRVCLPRQDPRTFPKSRVVPALRNQTC